MSQMQSVNRRGELHSPVRQGSFPHLGRSAIDSKSAGFGLGRSRLFSIGFEPRVDQRDDSVDDRMAHALLLGDQLHEFVGAFDVGRAVLQSTRGRGRTREALRRGSVFSNGTRSLGDAPSLTQRSNTKL